MTESYATDTSDDEVTNEKPDESIKPLEVIVTNQQKEKEEKNPTSEDTIDYSYLDATLTDEEIKEMQDAQ